MKTDIDLVVEARIRAHLRQQMQDREIHQTELARIAGIDNGNIKRILSGERGAGLGVVLRICDALKITPTRLLEQDPPDEFFRPGDKREHG